MASHLYDLIEYFAGPIRKITALTGNLVQDYKSEDASTTLLELQSGAQATVDSFFCIPDEASRTRLEIYGSAGAVLAEGTIGQSGGGKVEALLRVGSHRLRRQAVERRRAEIRANCVPKDQSVYGRVQLLCRMCSSPPAAGYQRPWKLATDDDLN